MDSPTEELTVAQVKKMTVVQLRGQLSARKLSASGVKKDLIKRLLDATGLSEPKEEKPAPLHVPGDGWPGSVPNVSMRAMGSEVVASYLAQQQAALQSAKKAADAARAASSAEEASDVEPALAVSQAVRPKRGRQTGGKRQKASTEVVSSTRVLRSQRRQETTDENVQMGGNQHEASVVEPFTVVGDVQNESVVKGKIEDSSMQVEALPVQPEVIVDKTESTMGPFSVKDSLATETSKRVMEVKYPSHATGESMFKDEKEEKEMEEVGTPVQKCSDIFNVDELLKTPSQPLPIVLETLSEGISSAHSDNASKLQATYSRTSMLPRDEDKLLANTSLTILDSDSDTSISADSFTPSPDVPCSDIIVHGDEKFFSQKSVAEEQIRESKDKIVLSTPEETITSADTSSEDGMDIEATQPSLQMHSPKDVDNEHVSDESTLVREADAEMDDDEIEAIDLTTARSPASSEELEEPSREEEEETGDSFQEIPEVETSGGKSNEVEENLGRSPPTKRPTMTEEQISEPKRKWKTSHDFAPSTVISTKVIESAGQEFEVFATDRCQQRKEETIQEVKMDSIPTVVASCDTLGQNEASNSREKAAQKKSALPAKINVNSNVLSFDVQWDILSEINPELTEAIALRGPVSPTQKQPTKVVRVTGLSRPYAVRTLRDTMALFGSFPSTHFWINKIRSVCIVQYDSVESAVNAREALHKVRWPKTNQHCLHVDYGCEGDVEYLNGEGRDDTATVLTGSESSRSASFEDETEYLKDSSPEVGDAPDLDNLFKKTKTKPTIYYLPYTKEEAEKAEMEREKRRQERIKYLAKDKGEASLRKVSKASSPAAASSTRSRKHGTKKSSSSSEQSDGSSSSSESVKSNSSRRSGHSSDHRSHKRYRRSRSSSKSSSSGQYRRPYRRWSRSPVRRRWSRSPSSNAYNRRRDYYNRSSFRDRYSFERRRYYGGRR
ncbi:SAP domain protein [Trichuris suis]|nr:SAP domain protein [Trichuris suis]